MSKAIELAEEAERLSAENIPRAWIFGPEARALVREMASELRNMQGILEDLANPHALPGESPLETLRRVLRKPSEAELVEEACRFVVPYPTSTWYEGDVRILRDWMTKAAAGEEVDPGWFESYAQARTYVAGALRKGDPR